MNFTKRLERAGLRHLADHLPQTELDAVAGAYNEALKRLEGGQSFQDHRQQLDSRVSGTGVSQLPHASDRASILGNRGFGGEQQLQAKGHLAGAATARVSMVGNGATQAWLSLMDRMPKESHRRSPGTPTPASSAPRGPAF